MPNTPHQVCIYTAKEHGTLNTTLTSHPSGKSFNYLFGLNELRMNERQPPNTLVVLTVIYLHYALFRKAPHLSCLTKTLKIIQFDYIVDPFMINLFSHIM